MAVPLVSERFANGYRNTSQGELQTWRAATDASILTLVKFGV